MTEKYKFNLKEAQAFSDFMMPMLRWDPNKRATAEEMLKHSWLCMPADYNPKVQEEIPSAIEDVDHYYYKVEMAELTAGSEKDCAEAEMSDEDPFSGSDFSD
jgi:serine/threonine protein kinase